jgi:hypothetical protein
MATDIVGSLFGVTPEGLDAARQQQMREQAMAYAQLTPQQQITYGAALGGQQFGRSIGGLLGAEDPEMRLVRLRSSITQTMDPTNIESLTGAIQKLQSAGDTVGALNLTNILRNLQKMQAETIKATREGTPKESQIAASRADAIATRGTPEWATAYKNSLEQQVRFTTDAQRNAAEYASTENEFGSQQWNTAYKAKLEELLKKEKTGQIKEVGVAVGTQQPVYLDPNTDQQYIYVKGQDGKQVRQPYFGGVDITRSKTQVSVTQQGQEEFMKQLGKIDANKVQDAMNARETSIATLNSLNRLNQLNQEQLISGSFASGRVGATNLLNTLGLISDKDVDRLSSSENYQKIAGDVILGTLGGKLGAGFSNDDRKFIQSLVPQLENSASARKRLIEYMVRKNNEIVNEATRLETYARDNMSLKGYTPQIPIVNVGTPGSDLRSMSTEELKKRLNQ